jgi:hypothetical protein
MLNTLKTRIWGILKSPQSIQGQGFSKFLARFSTDFKEPRRISLFPETGTNHFDTKENAAMRCDSVELGNNGKPPYHWR